jgi:hypothetical protein
VSARAAPWWSKTAAQLPGVSGPRRPATVKVRQRGMALGKRFDLWVVRALGVRGSLAWPRQRHSRSARGIPPNRAATALGLQGGMGRWRGVPAKEVGGG